MMGAKEKTIEKMIDTEELMQILGVSKAFLDDARTKLNLPYYKIGRNVKYRLSEVEQWLRERRKNG